MIDPTTPDRDSESASAPTIADPDGYFLPAGSGSRHQIFPGVEIQTTAGRGIMLEGRLEFTVGGVTRVLGPGDLWRIPGGVPHSVRALDGPAVALDVFHPIREDYL